MICAKPFVPIGSSVYYPCYSCKACRINRARLWAARIGLEARCHDLSCFVTLTYKDGADGTVPNELKPTDTQDWIRELRRLARPNKIRYYLVGEYGPETLRPHYHAILFGLGQYAAGGSDGLWLQGRQGLVRESWRLGGSVVGSVTSESMAYVAGYVVEKIEKKNDPRLHGFTGEFQRMSLRPGIGASAVPNISAVLGSDFGLQSIADSGDVPLSLRVGRSHLPLGRYLRGKLRQELGLDCEKIKSENNKKQVAEMFALRGSFQEAARVLSKSPAESAALAQRLMLDNMSQKFKNLVSRREVFKQFKSL